MSADCRRVFVVVEVSYFVTMLSVDFSLELRWAWVRSRELYCINLMRLLHSVGLVFGFKAVFSPIHLKQ